MKKALVLLTSVLLATGAFAAKEEGAPIDKPSRGELDCTGATNLTCGLTATNADPAMGGNVTTYSCTTLNYGQCGEVVYEVCLGGDGTLQVDMTYNHTADNDLDLFLLGSCDEADCIDASLGTSGAESVSADLTAGTYYVVVDGWSGNCDGLGEHVVTVTCDSPCIVSNEPTSWSEIKARYDD